MRPLVGDFTRYLVGVGASSIAMLRVGSFSVRDSVGYTMGRLREAGDSTALYESSGFIDTCSSTTFALTFSSLN